MEQIVFSAHAKSQMIERGASKEEVIETTPPEAPDLSAIEVEKRGKEEEAEASEAEETAKE